MKNRSFCSLDMQKVYSWRHRTIYSKSFRYFSQS